MKKTDHSRTIVLLLLTLTFFAIAAVLKITSSVILPLTISILISLVFEPVITKLNKKFRIPWVVCIFIVLVLLAGGIYAVATLLYSSISAIINQYPKYEERFLTIYSTIAAFFDLPFNEDDSFFNIIWEQVGGFSFIRSVALSLSNWVIGFGKNFVMILLFSVFFMLDLRFLRQKVAFASMSAKRVPSSAEISGAQTEDGFSDANFRSSQIINDIISQVTRYMSTKFFISLLTGVLVYLGAKIISMDFAIIWAFLAFILNFIPNFGSIISVLGTSIFALLQFWPQPGPVIFVILYMTLVNFGLGNILEPRVQGKNLGLSPFIILASLSLWGWLWGFAGLVLGVPMMVLMKIVCENVDILNPVSIILGTWPLQKKEETPVKPQENASPAKNNKNHKN